MKSLIVYYSYTGNNALLASYLGEKLGSDLFAIEECDKRTGFTIFLDVFLKRSPDIKPLTKNLNDYDSVILLAPLWAGKFASPLKSFLKQNGHDLRKYFFITFAGGNPSVKDQLPSVKEELKKITGKDPVGLFELDIGEMFSPEQRDNPNIISQYKLKSEDLTRYQGKIEAIITQLSLPIR